MIIGILIGLILGILLSLMVFVLVRKREADIVRVLEEIAEKTGGQKAYIAGLSEEEQNFSDRVLTADKDIKLD